MEFSDLRKFQRVEKSSKKLGELPESFYQELYDLVSKYREEYDAQKTGDALKKLENLLNVARDLFEKREQKIVLRALRNVRTGDDDFSGVVGEEKDFLQKLQNILQEHRKWFEGILVGQAVFERKVIEEKIEPIESEKPKEEEEGLNMVLVRILKDIPRFVSSDLKEYGPFEANALVKLPEREAKLLEKRGLVEVL